MIQLIIVKVNASFWQLEILYKLLIELPERQCFHVHSHITPGCLVRHPSQTDWGIGQVQSVIGNRITVNFQNAGKRVINAQEIDLDVIDSDPRG